MADRMTFWGIGPRLALFTFAYSIIPAVLTHRYPEYLIISFVPASVFKTLGIILLAVGIPLWAVSAKTIRKGFHDGVLCTRGVYSLVRHPVYSSIIVFIVPGILMFRRSWALFSIPFAAYFILKELIKKEELYLAERFGDEYLSYKSKVRTILPFPRF